MLVAPGLAEDLDAVAVLGEAIDDVEVVGGAAIAVWTAKAEDVAAGLTSSNSGLASS